MVEPIQRQRTVFPSTSGPNMFDRAGPVRDESLGQGRLPFFDEGRAGRGNYQGDPVFTAPVGEVNEISMGNRYPAHSYFDVDKPYRQEAGLRGQPPQGIERVNRGVDYDKIFKYLDQFDWDRNNLTPSGAPTIVPDSYDPSIVEELYKKGVGPMDLGDELTDTQSSLRGGFDRGQRITEGLSVVADVEDDNAAVMKLDALGFDMEAIEEIMSQRDLEQTAKVYNVGDPEMVNRGAWSNILPGGDPFFNELTPGAEGINSILSNPVFNQMIESGFGSEKLYEAIPDYLKDTIPSDAFRNMHDWENQQQLDLDDLFLYPEQDIGAG